MHKAILFDLGRVLIHFDFVRAYEGMAPLCGFPASEIPARLAPSKLVERFETGLIEPGNLLLLSYIGDVPIVAAPGCFRSAKPNVVDLLLPPLLARYRVTGWEIACLGHGGLLA